MRALRVLADPKIWLMIAGAGAVLALIYFAYLAAVASPEENLEDLPVALVNEDEGGRISGKEVNLGARVVETVTAADSPAADTVEWARPDSRDEALERMDNGEYYGAIVIPDDYSQRISSIVGPPAIPIAVVNEDEGAGIGGRQIKLGEEVARRITAPDSASPPFVEWTRTEDRAAALKGLERGSFHAAIVLPRDYSQRLASASGAPTGRPPAPAEIELLTSPAVRPSTTALIENAFSGIVGGVSKATGERILGALLERGVPVPPKTGEVVADPVEGTVSEADVSAEAGPLPKAPRAAEIEVMTNPSAGQTATLPVQNISMGIVQAVSRATSERITDAAAERGRSSPPRSRR